MGAGFSRESRPRELEAEWSEPLKGARVSTRSHIPRWKRTRVSRGFFAFLDFRGEMLWFEALGYEARFWTIVMPQSLRRFGNPANVSSGSGRAGSGTTEESRRAEDGYQH